MQISETVRSVGDRRTVCLLRWEFINENKKVRKKERVHVPDQESDQENDQEKKKGFRSKMRLNV